MLLFFILATLATLDCLFSFFITATFVTFYSAYKAQGRGEQTIALALLGVSVAGAFLTKGFLAFVIPFVGIVPFMVWERRFFDLFKLCWIPLLVVGALTVPWGLAMHAHSPDFWNFFFWNEHVRRFSSKDAQHSQPFWFYIPVLILGVLPWSFFFPSLVTARGKVTSSEIGRYALCWFLFPFILLSIASGKLPTYILPCFPPLAILLAIALEGRNEILSQSYMKRCAYGFSGLLAGGATIFALVCLFYSGKHPIYVVHSEWYKLLLIVGAALGWAFAWHHAVKNNSFKLFALGPVCLMVVASWIIPNRTLDQKFPEKLLREHQSEIPSNALFVSDQRLTASAGWILRRSDIYVFDWPGEMEYGFSYEDGKARWLVDIGALKALFAQNGGKQPIVLSGRSSKFKPAIEMLGPPTALYEDASHLIAVYK